MALRFGWLWPTKEDIEMRERGMTIQDFIDEANANGKNYERPSTRTWGEVFGTIILTLDLTICFFTLLILLILYLALPIPDNSDQHVEDQTLEGTLSGGYQFLDTLIGFYSARGIGIAIDFIFRSWEGIVFARVVRLAAIGDRKYIDDTIRKRHQKVVAIREWAVGIGRIISTVLFFRFYNAGWWTRQAIHTWMEHHEQASQCLNYFT